jgi:uncharacterized protein (TIGR00645 family)
MASKLEQVLAAILYGSRWIMAPCYLGLVAALVAILVAFFRELVHAAGDFAGMTSAAVILAVLKLIDLLLVGNLVLIMIFAGVETLATRTADADRPQWMGTYPAGYNGFRLTVHYFTMSYQKSLPMFLWISRQFSHCPRIPNVIPISLLVGLQHVA